jgi:hypothetical protein
MKTVPLLCLLLGGCALPPPATTMSWQVPAGWSSESNTFPLSFASGLPYRGTEEVRFAPGMYRPGARDFWTYSLVWALVGEPAVGESDLETNLTTYFKGMTEAVGGSKYTFDPSRYRVTLDPASETSISGHATKRFIGKAALYDGFTTGLPIELNAEGFVWQCPMEKKTFVMFVFSPSARSAEVVENARSVAGGFRCHLGYTPSR